MKFRSHKKKQNNSRINMVLAVVFLLSLGLVFRLYELQVVQGSYYRDMAMGQHQVSSSLVPKRGKIFISEGANSDEIYPFATNKDFALIYAVPKDLPAGKNQKIAEIFYEIFKKEEVDEEVEEILQKEYEDRLKKEIDYLESLNLISEELAAKKQKAIAEHEALLFDKHYLEFRQIKKEKETELRQEKIISEYLAKLDKKDDPYEPLEKKVPEDILLEVYSRLSFLYPQNFSKEDLILKGGRVFVGEDEVELTGISHMMSVYRFYPEGDVGAHLLGFVNDENQGNYGLEGFFNKELTGEKGSIKSELAADRDMIIINDREYQPARDGQDLVLTLNRSAEFTVCEKLKKGVEKYGADGGVVMVSRPETGEILAMCSEPSFDPNNYTEVEDIKIFNNPAVFGSYEPGSIFKTITMAAAINEGAVEPQTIFEDKGQIMIEGWHKPIKNSDFDTAGAHGKVDMNTVLELSLNTGSIFAMRQTGKEKFAEYVKNFGFGEKTGIEMSGESKGNISNISGERIGEIYAATASFGQGITVNTLQMLMAYGAIANNGVLMKPYIVKEFINPDGAREETRPVQVRRVISEKAATLLSGMLVNVVEGGHAKLAGVEGFYVGGKTGTAQVASSKTKGYGSETIHTFVGFAPAGDPEFVMLVRLDNPKNAVYSASSAAPLFGEIAEFLLQYYEVSPERRIKQ